MSLRPCWYWLPIATAAVTYFSMSATPVFLPKIPGTVAGLVITNVIDIALHRLAIPAAVYDTAYVGLAPGARTEAGGIGQQRLERRVEKGFDVVRVDPARRENAAHDLRQAVALTQSPVLGEKATRLTHEPDRRRVGRFTTAGRQEAKLTE